MLKGKIHIKKEKIPTLAFFIFISIISLASFKDFGISADEQYQRDHLLVNTKSIYKRLGIIKWAPESVKKAIDIKEYPHKYYGVAIQYPLVLLEYFPEYLNPNEPTFWYLRHLYTRVLFVTAGIFFYLIIKKITTSKEIAFITLLLFFFHPRIAAHSYYNIKDSIFLSLMTISTWFMIRFFEEGTYKDLLLFSSLAAITTIARTMGILLIATYFIWILISWLNKEDENNKESYIKISVALILSVVMAVFLYAKSPYTKYQKLNISLRMTSSSEGFGKFYTRGTPEKFYRDKNKHEFKVKKGSHEYLFSINVPSFASFRIDPLDKKGDFLIEELSIMTRKNVYSYDTNKLRDILNTTRNVELLEEPNKVGGTGTGEAILDFQTSSPIETQRAPIQQFIIITGLASLIFLGIYTFNRKWLKIKTNHRSMLGKNILVLIVFLLTLFLLWPVLWENPLKNFIEALNQFGNYDWGGNIIYNGTLIRGTQIPMTYIPTWILITTPIGYLIWIIIGTLRDFKNESAINITFFASISIVVGSYLAVVLMKSTLYTDWRHLYYIYPYMLIIATFGVEKLRISEGKMYKILVAITITSILITLSWMYKNHPHYYVYFNNIARKDFDLKWDRDFWQVSGANQLKNLAKNLPEGKTYTLKREDFIERGYVMLNDEEKKKIQIVEGDPLPDFILTGYRGIIGDITLKELSFYTEYNSIYVDGKKIMTLFKKTSTTL
ncbi:MAG TPA: glycosyltransferase family 39 protein [bacterium]|nr:glycosyltransferase family 39 protein [bacterium]